MNQPEEIATVAFGERVTVGSDGKAHKAPLPESGRIRALIEEFGISVEVAGLLLAQGDLDPLLRYVSCRVIPSPSKEGGSI